jgi:serine/threonine protein kinase/formylglycine-generating enzyme required for sulfatase activity
MTFCTNCGKNLRAGATQCDACGTAISAASSSQSDAPTSLNLDAEKPQNSAPTDINLSAGPSTDANNALPISSAVGSQSGRLLGGRYKLEQCIGSGGMGEIYRARRMHIGDTVAVKVLRADVVEDEKSRQRFYREARAAAMLHHPNAVVIHDFGEDADGTAYIVMELLVGRSLRQVLIQEGTINAVRAYGIIRQASAALDAGHRNGIVHRDIKPDNIILLDSNDAADHVKILDFGIAKVLDNKTLDTHSLEQRLTNVGSVIGTPHYMAPEQCQGEEADSRSDIYSLGVVLYELLTGVAPFLAKTPTGVAIKHVTEKPRPLREINPSVPEAVDRVVLHALEKDPNARPQTALELARAFENALVNEQDTVRFIRSGESQRITTSMIGAIGDPEVARTPTQPGAPVPSQNFETAVAPPQSAPQNFETTISPPPSSQDFETTVSPSTGADQLKQSGEAATEFIARVQTTAEPPKPAGEAATEFIARVQTTAEPPKPGATPSAPSAQVIPGTELLPKSEDRPQIKPVEPAKRQEAGKKPSPADKPEKKEEKKEQKKEKKKDATPSPIKKPAATPTQMTQIMQQPAVLIGAAALVAIIAVIAFWQYRRHQIQQEQRRQQEQLLLQQQRLQQQEQLRQPPPGMVYVPGGEFRLGRDGDDVKESEKPAHPVTVAPFFIDITEVTNEQYQKFVDSKGHTPPPVWQGNHFPVDANKVPVTDVTWEDVKAYAEWLGDGKRLPTEEEWEFAARGTDGRIYPWGPEWAPNLSNSKSDDNEKQRLIEVGQFPKGASPFGLLDMAGNAWEWTASDYKEYSGAQYNPPKGFKNLKVIRGGNFDSARQSVTTTVRRPWPATRDDWAPGEIPAYKDTGFRLAKDVPKQQDTPKQ